MIGSRIWSSVLRERMVSPNLRLITEFTVSVFHRGPGRSRVGKPRMLSAGYWRRGGHFDKLSTSVDSVWEQEKTRSQKNAQREASLLPERSEDVRVLLGGVSLIRWYLYLDFAPSYPRGALQCHDLDVTNIREW